VLLARVRWVRSTLVVLSISLKSSIIGNQGLGIAYVAALRAKVAVQLYDRSPEQISKGLNLMDRLLAKDTAKGKVQEADARQARERVSVIDHTVGVRGLRDVDMVIEVRRQVDLLCFTSVRSTSTHIRRPSRRISKSSSAYSRNWQPR